MTTPDSIQRKLYRLLLAGLLISALSGCGGGSSSATPPPGGTTQSSDWDQLVWDQDNWG